MTPLPAHDTTAERALLGALLLSGNAYYEIEDIVTPGDFYTPAHQILFDIIADLVTSGRPVDLVAIANVLETTGKLDMVGGGVDLLDMTATTPAISNVAHYARIVADMAMARRIAGVAREIQSLAVSAANDVEAAVDRCGRLVDELASSQTRATLPTIAEVVGRYRETMDHPVESVPTGFAELDNVIGGWTKGDLNIVGAPSGGGKTSLLISAAMSACTAGRPVLFHTLEMSADELQHRMIAALTGIPLHKIVRRSMTAGERARRDDALNTITGWPLFIVDDPQPTWAQMKANARSIRRIYGEIGVGFFDYLQLKGPEPGEKSDARYVEVGTVSRNFKAIARNTNMSWVAGVQLNNASLKRSDRRGQIDDIRESSAPYHDSSVAIFLYREGFYNRIGDQAADNATELIVRKQRNGPAPRTVSVDWVPDLAMFRGRDALDRPPQFQTFANATLPTDE